MKAEKAQKQEMKIKMRHVRLAMSLVPFLIISSSHAQQMNEPDSPCARVVVTSDLVACLSKARASSDTEMNSLYQRIKATLDASEGEQLIKTQRLWIKYRDANCSAERSLYDPGTGGPPADLACLEAMTRERAKELRVTYAVRLKLGPNDPNYCLKVEHINPNLIVSVSVHLKGRVADQSGAPVKKTPVELKRYVSEAQQVSVRKVTTDSDGNFDLGSVTKGQYRLLPSATRAFRQPDKLECNSGGECSLDIALQANGTDSLDSQCPIR
jgi:uncharacterized protein YecT (DUF1311 family)